MEVPTIYIVMGNDINEGTVFVSSVHSTLDGASQAQIRAEKSAPLEDFSYYIMEWTLQN
jgi:hypothetical protein